MKIETDIQFICEIDGMHVFWVKFGDSGRMVTVRPEDLEEEVDP